MSDTNVLLVVLDCVRARNTSVHGYRRRTTPVLEEFAETATTYTQARSPAGWSLPSHASLLTGVSPAAHRMQITDRLREGHTVFEDLSARGYDTAVFSENPYLTVHASDLRTAFDEVVTERDDETRGISEDDPDSTVDGFWYADRFGEWLDDQDGNWAACINLMDAHTPYETRPEYDDWQDSFAEAIHDQLPFKWRWAVYGDSVPQSVAYPLRELYDGAIKQADAAFGRVLELLDSAGAAEETLVVVTADHGDGFGELPAAAGDPIPLMHGMGTHEVVYHVPLLTRAPGQTEARTVSSLADLSRFPAVVETALSGGDTPDPGWFTADDGRVVSFQAAPNAQEAEKARQFTENPERFLQEMSIVYTDGPGDSVYKHASWGGETYAARIRGTAIDSIPPETDGVCTDDPLAVADGIAAGTTARISEPLDDGEDELDKYDNNEEIANVDVEQRLEDLGYL